MKLGLQPGTLDTFGLAVGTRQWAWHWAAMFLFQSLIMSAVAGFFCHQGRWIFGGWWIFMAVVCWSFLAWVVRIRLRNRIKGIRL